MVNYCNYYQVEMCERYHNDMWSLVGVVASELGASMPRTIVVESGEV